MAPGHLLGGAALATAVAADNSSAELHAACTERFLWCAVGQGSWLGRETITMSVTPSRLIRAVSVMASGRPAAASARPARECGDVVSWSRERAFLPATRAARLSLKLDQSAGVTPGARSQLSGRSPTSSRVSNVRVARHGRVGQRRVHVPCNPWRGPLCRVRQRKSPRL